jgi:quercetin dioxygenase-like cupin family protein
MVAPGAVTAGRYGLVEYHVAPHSPGAMPHVHRTFSESFYVLSGELTIYAAGSWRPFSPGDYALVHEGGSHGFRNDGDEWASFLILFAPGSPGSCSSSSWPSCAAAAARSHRRR